MIFLSQRLARMNAWPMLCAVAIALLAWPLCACADVRTPAPEPGARIIFVSPSGDNSNPGTSPSTPVATIQVGLDRLRDQNADWLLLQRGHTYTAGPLARLPRGRNADSPAILGGYGEGTTPNLIVSAAAAEFSFKNRRDQHVHVYHVNLLHQTAIQPSPTILWSGVTPEAVDSLEHEPGNGIQDILNGPVGQTNVVFDVSGELFKNTMPSLLLPLRTRLSGAGTDRGVSLHGWKVQIQDAPDAGMEHLRIHLGDVNVQDAVDNFGNVLRVGKGDRSQPGDGADCVQVFRSPDVVLSNLSLFWGMDEGVSVAASPGVSLFRCIIAECLSEAYHTGDTNHGDRIYEHSKALYVNGWDVPNGFLPGNYAPIVVRECLIANTVGRCPAWSDSLPALSNGGATLLNLAFVNNVVYNSGTLLIRETPFVGPDPTIRLDFVGNVFILGPDSPTEFKPEHWANLINTVNNPNGSVYIADNWVIDQQGVTHDLLDWMDAHDLPWADQPHFTHDQPLTTGADAILDTVLTHAGDYTHRDEHDWRAINDTRNNTGDIIDSQTEVID